MNGDPWQMNYTGVIRLLVGCLTPEDGLTPVCLWAIVTGLGGGGLIIKKEDMKSRGRKVGALRRVGGR